ncbi:MAG TPA: hypothetical protein VNG33_15360 [Polyangiaceae bacterium]|nr:hypothetical protein [Polyangiaceae bacterium]
MTAVASPAAAKPQWNAGLETGVCGTGSSLGFEKVGWCNAAHADVLWLRESGRDFGLGPSLRLGSARFSDLRLDAGLSALIPTFESFPLVLEAGPYVRNLNQPGVFGSAFFGLRSFNYYGHYEMAAGLSLIAERSFSAGTPSAIWITARIDGSWLALPFVFAYNALR